MSICLRIRSTLKIPFVFSVREKLDIGVRTGVQWQDVGTDPFVGGVIARRREVQEEEDAVGVQHRRGGCGSRHG